MPNIGPLELVIVFVIALIVLGPKRLPEVGRSVGRGMREFKDSIQGKDDDAVEEARRELGTPTDENEPVVTARERDSI
jgi:sec-independent protein translocase protein TatA